MRYYHLLGEESMRENPADDGRYVFVHSCPGSTAKDISNLRESERQITRRTFQRKLGPSQWAWIQRELGYDRDCPITQADWQIPYFMGIYRGVPAVFLVWSGFEYIFTLDGKLGPSADPGFRRPSGPPGWRHFNPPCMHAHPKLTRPVSRAEVEQELRGLWRRGGLPGRPQVSWPRHLEQTHMRQPRRYAQVWLGPVPRFELAEQTRWLPTEHRLGLLAHEVGHVLATDRSEVGADHAARRELGLRVGYDHRWPGKGLQRANPGKIPFGSAKAAGLARAFFASLPRRDRDELGDQLVLGIFDWRDWLDDPPPPGFVSALGRLWEEWEQGRANPPRKARWAPTGEAVRVIGEAWTGDPRWLLVAWLEGPMAGEQSTVAAHALVDARGRPLGARPPRRARRWANPEGEDWRDEELERREQREAFEQFQDELGGLTDRMQQVEVKTTHCLRQVGMPDLYARYVAQDVAEGWVNGDPAPLYTMPGFVPPQDDPRSVEEDPLLREAVEAWRGTGG